MDRTSIEISVGQVAVTIDGTVSVPQIGSFRVMQESQVLERDVCARLLYFQNAFILLVAALARGRIIVVPKLTAMIPDNRRTFVLISSADSDRVLND